MPFDSESGRNAGKRSKKKAYSEKLKPLLHDFLLTELEPEQLRQRMREASPNQRLKFISETLNYVLPKANEVRIDTIQSLTEHEAVELINAIRNEA